MFGYVKPEKGSLLCKEYDFYRATYCGICRQMKKTTGLTSPLFLQYDSVFLALVRMTYLPDTAFSSHMGRCIAHPCKSRVILDANEAITYTARVFSVLGYHKMKDDLADEKFGKKVSLLPVRPLLSSAKRQANLSELDGYIEGKLSAIRDLEAAGCGSIDEPAARFGELLGKVFSFGTSGEAETVLSQIGFHLGKFILAADAAEDYEKDGKSGTYNPFVIAYGGEKLTQSQKELIRAGLILTLEDLAKAVEFLPFGSRKILEGIIRNITYRGLVRRVDFLLENPPENEPEIQKEVTP